MGITLFALVFGKVPFFDDNILALYSKIRNQPVEFPEKPLITDSLKSLITKMLIKDPSNRITLPDIKVKLLHLVNYRENSLHYIFFFQEDSWVTKNQKFPLPSEEENCHLVEITEEDVARVVTSIPKLDTLILIKHMLKKHSFQVNVV